MGDRLTPHRGRPEDEPEESAYQKKLRKNRSKAKEVVKEWDWQDFMERGKAGLKRTRKEKNQ